MIFRISITLILILLASLAWGSPDTKQNRSSRPDPSGIQWWLGPNMTTVPEGEVSSLRLYWKDFIRNPGTTDYANIWVDHLGNLNLDATSILINGSPIGSGGADDFLDLDDTPATYDSFAGFLVSVTDEEDGLEFIDPSTVGTTDFLGLSDTPADYDSSAGFFVRVDDSEESLEFSQFVDLESDVTGRLPYANLAQAGGLSVLGRSADSSGDVAAITASTDHQVLRRSGNSIAFGSLNLSSSDATTGTLSASSVQRSDLQGTTNQISLSASGTGVLLGNTNITLSLPQDIHTGSDPSFGSLTLSDLTEGRVVFVGEDSVMEDSENFLWDSSNSRLGIGGSPADQFQVTGGNIRIKSNANDNNTTHTGIIFTTDVDARSARILTWRGASSHRTGLRFLTWDAEEIDALLLDPTGDVDIITGDLLLGSTVRISNSGEFTGTDANFSGQINLSRTTGQIRNVLDDSTTRLIDFDFPNADSNTAAFRFFRGTPGSGSRHVDFFRGDGTSTLDARIGSGSVVTSFDRNALGGVAIGGTSVESGMRMHIHGNSRFGAISQSSGTFFRGDGAANSFLRLTGGTAAATGGNVVVYGQSHPTRPNQFVVFKDNTERMRVEDGGGVVIANSMAINDDIDANARLKIQGAGTQALRIRNTGGATVWGLGADASGHFNIDPENASTRHVLIHNSGDGDARLGVGTTSPASTLHILGTNDNTGGIRIESTAGGLAERLAIFPAGNLSVLFDALASNAQIGFRSSSGFDYFRMVGSRVGIGTSSPSSSYLLDIDGDTNVNGGLDVSGKLSVSNQFQHAVGNSGARTHKTALSGTINGSTLYKIGEFTFTGNSQNMIIRIRVEGQTGGIWAATEMIGGFRSNTLPAKQIFWRQDKHQRSSVRDFDFQIWEDTSTGRVAIGWIVNGGGMQNAGWTVEILERSSIVDVWEHTSSLTTLDTTGLTAVTDDSANTLRTFSGHVNFASTYQGARVMRHVNITPASNTSVSVSGRDMVRANPSANIQITGLTSGVQQQQVTILNISSAKTVTINNGGSFVLDGNAVLGLHGTLTLVQEGALWVEISRNGL